MPGVGYVEMAFAASSGRALAAVAFLRPCVLPEPGRGEKCVLRCTQRSGALEIASARGTKSSSFASCFAGTLANIESGCTESILGREFGARTERSITLLSTRCSTAVPQGTLGPRPRVIESSSRIGGTAWRFSTREFLCSASRQSYRNMNQMNVASNASKRTHLHPEQRQLCNSLRGTLLSRSRWPASHALVNK